MIPLLLSLTPLLASDINAEGWVLIITAIFVGVANIVKLILDFMRESKKAKQEAAKEERDKAVAAVVTTTAKTVNETKKLATTAAEVSISTDLKVDAIQPKVEAVERQTNGMTEALRADLRLEQDQRAKEQAAHAAEVAAHKETRDVLDVLLTLVPPEIVGKVAEKLPGSKSDIFKAAASVLESVSETDTVKG